MAVHRLGVIGAGARGRGLARAVVQCPDRAMVWAVAEPDETARGVFAKEFSVTRTRCFQGHQELLDTCPELDGVFVATPVPDHVAVACDCLKAGVPVYLEKPMALSVAEARRIAETAELTGVRLQVGFNLRYAPLYVRLKHIVAEGLLGRLLSIEWKEALAPSHWASYCRHPTYNRRAAIGSWLMEKCCHDLDILNWIVDAPCVRVASFGSRSHFTPRPDVPEVCSEDCPIEEECLFSALGPRGERDRRRRADQPRQACVYHSGSDLVDHQTAILEYANGVTVALSLLPLTHFQSRYVHICGTDATLRGLPERNELRVHRYDEGDEVVCDPAPLSGGHGGADPGIVGAFLDWLDDVACTPKNTAAEGLEAMVVACGIDLAMREGRVVTLDDLRHSDTRGVSASPRLTSAP